MPMGRRVAAGNVEVLSDKEIRSFPGWLFRKHTEDALGTQTGSLLDTQARMPVLREPASRNAC